MNPSVAVSNPSCAVCTLVAHWPLVRQLVTREIRGRYKGSFLGVFWSFINPLLMLAVYTFVFGFVFKSRWGTGTSGHVEFAVLIFAGLMVHALTAECLNRAPNLIVSNPNFVKKVVFPVEILAWVAIGTALFHTCVASLIFVAAILVWKGGLPPTIVFIPFVFLPLILLLTGLVWFLASLGVYLRDLGQIIGIITSLLMFLAPVFYPIDAVSARLRPFLYANPLTFIIEQLRGVAIEGTAPDWLGWLLYIAIAYLVSQLGFTWFQRTRRGFADVI